MISSIEKPVVEFFVLCLMSKWSLSKCFPFSNIVKSIKMKSEAQVLQNDKKKNGKMLLIRDKKYQNPIFVLINQPINPHTIAKSNFCSDQSINQSTLILSQNPIVVPINQPIKPYTVVISAFCCVSRSSQHQERFFSDSLFSFFTYWIAPVEKSKPRWSTWSCWRVQKETCRNENNHKILVWRRMRFLFKIKVFMQDFYFQRIIFDSVRRWICLHL